MTTNRRSAVAALTAAGLLWGTTVPLSKLALAWLSPGWLTFARFGIAAAILLVAARATLRAACSPAVLASGAIGYGGSVVVQNAGISRTSVSHAALLIGATPVMIAIIAALWHHAVARPVAWAGFVLSLAGVALVAGAGGGGATAGGDGLVLVSLLLSAVFTVAQTRLLPGRDPVAVTAVQFLGAAIAVLPVAVLTGGMPAAPTGPGAVVATVALVAGGTLLPFTLFAHGQSRVSAEVAGAFLNLEPLVGAIAGVVVFGNPAGPAQIAGGTAILAGIALSSLPLLAAGRQLAVGRWASDGWRVTVGRWAPGGWRAVEGRWAPLVLGDQVSRVGAVAGEPELSGAGAGLEREPLGAGGHRGAQGVPALAGHVHARAGVGGAVAGAAAVPGDVDVAAAPRRDKLVPAGRAIRRAGQQRGLLGAAKAGGRRGHETRPRGHGHHGAGRGPHQPLRSRRTGDRPPPVPRRRSGVDREPAARSVAGENAARYGALETAPPAARLAAVPPGRLLFWQG